MANTGDQLAHVSTEEGCIRVEEGRVRVLKGRA
jgi:hypothetical protein